MMGERLITDPEITAQRQVYLDKVSGPPGYAAMKDKLAMTALTDEQLAEIAARAEKATAGPWVHIGPSADPSGSMPIQWQHYNEIRTPDGGGKHDWPDRICQTIAGQDRPQSTLDFAFIAASRTDIPNLLATIANLKAEMAQAERRGMEKAAQLVDHLVEIEQRADQNRGVVHGFVDQLKDLAQAIRDMAGGVG